MAQIRRTVTNAKRSPGEAIQGTPTFDSSGQAVNTNASRTGDYAKNMMSSSTPPATIALSVLLAVAVLALIAGCVFWKVKKRRGQKPSGPQPYYSSSPSSTHFGMESQMKSSSFGRHSTDIEKPDNAFIINPFPNEQIGWVPQIKNYCGVPLVNGQLPKHVQAAREGQQRLKSLSRGDLLNEKPVLQTPPPSYAISNGDFNRSSDATLVRPGVPLTPDSTVTICPPTPPSPPKVSPLSIPSDPPSVPPSRFSLSPLPNTPGTGAGPLPSPARLSSFSYQHPQTPASPLRTSFPAKQLSSVYKSGTGIDGLPLPRLMSVINIFEPSLEDEMLIHIGDTVRMVEEYNDGWCLAQHVGKSDAPRGVVPRFCLIERQSAIPTSSSQTNLVKAIQASSKLG